ncbi:hypothetical protein M441DRAFT_139575 [Trichoderma asperellum CBS 433.97]|uniref:Uncharacterized protein n=1 Tax=Trichoderma asperellum (strain ATCC 204424 / CBS 433.97 / NBRC 101777) TaxID=1042311 RepID=A0A2T3Z929_TRIA4|nr:hypothetical protein M441DRAFT_139575 [Trichoderma asperellum CBS 433.97]PTB41290.1 hypothetical protein M441DRAFT_139575 [Trichoderma asperellum CBS 433.97]
MPSDIDAGSDAPSEPLHSNKPEHSQAPEGSDTSVGGNLKKPWRELPEFKSAEDNVQVSNVRDMRLFGNNMNAHS